MQRKLELVDTARQCELGLSIDMARGQQAANIRSHQLQVEEIFRSRKQGVQTVLKLDLCLGLGRDGEFSNSTGLHARTVTRHFPL